MRNRIHSGTGEARCLVMGVFFMVGLFLGLALCVQAQVPSDSVLTGFEPVGDYVLEVDGKASPKTEIYLSRKAPAYLFITPEIASPVLLVPRSGSVQTVHVLKLAKQSDGTIDLLADAVLEAKGQFQVRDNSVVFSVDDHEVVLKEKPPLLGVHGVTGMKAYNPQYGRLAAAYSPTQGVMETLRKQSTAIKVRVYFGSWCPFCQQYVPRMLKVAEQLADSQIAVDFYGLPRAISTDPVSSENDVQRVPTGVIYVNNKEVGRIQGDDWKNPELALSKVLP